MRRLLLTWLGWVGVGLVLVAPVAVEQGVARTSFHDRLGALPVEVQLAHDGVTTLDTGILGKIYWRRTGPGGFGVLITSTGPPMAGGTLASYVSPRFVRANVQVVQDPGPVAAAYAAELRHQVVTRSLRYDVVAGAVVGSLLLLLMWGRSPLPRAWSRSRRVATGAGVGVVALLASTGLAGVAFARWSGQDPTTEAHPLPSRPELSFSSPQTLEIAKQVQPFIEKNQQRIDKRAHDYETTADDGIRDQVEAHGASLRPRNGEEIVVAEADPQGSLVGTRVRRKLYDALEEQVGTGALKLRTIAGDISSNGTVAEADFVHGEATASPDIPVVAAKGDHDTLTTVKQLLHDGVPVPDTETVDAGGLRVASARDPEFKGLFGGLVFNHTGHSEGDVGAALRKAVDQDEPAVVLVHQPQAAEGYLGVDTATLEGGTSLTTPHDDGIPDLPPGIVTYGHLHEPAGPWVVWNTDGKQITWTVVTQLGTSGGAENHPTFNRFSTPYSVPLKPISVQLQYVNSTSKLQTGYVEITIGIKGTVTVGDRVDVGLPGGMPAAVSAP